MHACSMPVNILYDVLRHVIYPFLVNGPFLSVSILFFPRKKWKLLVSTFQLFKTLAKGPQDVSKFFNQQFYIPERLTFHPSVVGKIIGSVNKAKQVCRGCADRERSSR